MTMQGGQQQNSILSLGPHVDDISFPRSDMAAAQTLVESGRDVSLMHDLRYMDSNPYCCIIKYQAPFIIRTLISR